MSVQQYFNEVEAVCKVLDEWVSQAETNSWPVPTHDSEEFTAVWQAVELLSRAYAVLYPMAQFESSKAALVLPDVQVDQPKQPKVARLYDAQGRPLK